MNDIIEKTATPETTVFESTTARIVNLATSDLEAAKKCSQADTGLQAEARTPSRNTKKLKGMEARFSRSLALNMDWPNNLPYMLIATVDGKRRLLGGNSRFIAGKRAGQENWVCIDRGEISKEQAIRLARADNLHDGEKESAMQRAIGVQNAVAAGAPLKDVLAEAEMEKSYYTTLISTVDNLFAQVRQSLCRGELTDVQVRTIKTVCKADNLDEVKDRQLVADYITNPDLAKERKKAIETAKREEKKQAEETTKREEIEKALAEQKAKLEKEAEEKAQREKDLANKNGDTGGDDTETPPVVVDDTTRNEARGDDTGEVGGDDTGEVKNIPSKPSPYKEENKGEATSDPWASAEVTQGSSSVSVYLKSSKPIEAGITVGAFVQAFMDAGSINLTAEGTGAVATKGREFAKTIQTEIDKAFS